MPIFEYKCRKCGNTFEHLVLPTILEKAACPKCHSRGRNLEQLISMFATTNEYATTRQRELVRKQSRSLKHDQAQTERRLASED